MPSPTTSYCLSSSSYFILCFWHIWNKLPDCRCSKSWVLLPYLLWFGLLWSFWPFKGERQLRAAGKRYLFRGCWRVCQLLLYMAGWCCNKMRFISQHPQRQSWKNKVGQKQYFHSPCCCCLKHIPKTWRRMSLWTNLHPRKHARPKNIHFWLSFIVREQCHL